MNKRALREVAPLVRPLKVYAFDPSLGKRHGNEMTLNVAHEPLTPGPQGRTVAVIDYDASNDRYYRAVDLDDPNIALQGGLAPSEIDPRFHQQMVYAVAMKTIENFSHALGRKVRWRRRSPRQRARRDPVLRVFPHALQEANAFYDPGQHALFFGYFQASRREPGSNLVGQTIHTCLSHDIVAHETAHALLHDLRPYYLEVTGPDTLAFHEAFADIVAIFQHFSFREALVDHLAATGGLLYRAELPPAIAPSGERPLIVAERSRPNVLIGLAQQFGEALEMRAGLRSALGTPHDPTVLQRESEAHARGAVLLACVFDGFVTAYLRRMSDLMRLTQSAKPGMDLGIELARRLASDAARTAHQFMEMCVRALDYCPPVDVSFGDFLRALITVDTDLVREDEIGYRAALIEAFRARGVNPGEVASYSEESLRWEQPRDRGGRPLTCRGLRFDAIEGTQGAGLSRNARILNDFAVRNAVALRLDPKLPVQAFSFHPVYRVGQDGQLAFQMVAQLLQQRRVPLPGRPRSEEAVYRGGCTLIVDLPDGVVRYAVYKRIHSKTRLERQRDFRDEWNASLAGPFLETNGLPPRASFARLHRGY